MKTKIPILVIALWFCSYSTPLIAQDAKSLIEKLERVTTEKEPLWKLDRKLPIENLIVLRWSSGEARIFMSITTTNSPAKAKEVYDLSVTKLSEQRGKGTRSNVTNLGADNELWTGHNEEGSAAIHFRQGRVHVLLFAPSEDVAGRFARYVSDLLPASGSTQPESSAQAWKEYSSVTGGFSVLFPGTPTLHTQEIEAAPGVRFDLRIHKVSDLAEYSVMYADYPIPVGDPNVAKSVLDSGAEGAVAAVNAELLELKEISHDGNPGRYLKERMPGRQIMRVKMILVGQHLYQVAITTPPEEGKSAETVKGYTEMADRFLNSFRLLATSQKLVGDKM